MFKTCGTTSSFVNKCHMKSNREFLKCIYIYIYRCVCVCVCALVPAGEACRVRPVEGKLVPHPTAVQATSTKL